MARVSMRSAVIAAVGVMWISSAFAQPRSRSVLLLDKGWQFYPMTDFQAWPAEPRITADQIKQLKVPQLGAGWQPVQIPDDYVVRGTISPNPNASLLAAGAVCALGGRECEVPNDLTPESHPGALNRPGRSPYGGHGYLPLYPAWYQRKVVIPVSSKGKSIWVDFGGDPGVRNRSVVDRRTLGFARLCRHGALGNPDVPAGRRADQPGFA